MNQHHRLLDAATWIAAGVAAVSLTQAAVAMSLVAATVSVILGCIRLHDRVKYGPSRDDG